MKTLIVICLFLAIFSIGCVPVASEKPLNLDFEYIGLAVQKKDTHVWGSSPVIGKDGKVHLYVAEWPMPGDEEEKFSGWYKHSRIAHYVGDSPEGPFEFLRIAVPDKDGKFNAPHNPTIRQIDGKYVLSFIVNEGDDTSTQRIIMYVADDLNDEWRPAKGALPDGTILSLPTNKNIWSHESCRGITNPSLIKFGDQYLMYFKAVICDSETPSDWMLWHFGYGVAISDDLEGPYEYFPDRITPEELQLEDVAAFGYQDKVYMLSRDIRGTLGSHEGGIIWNSSDGLVFTMEDTQRSFEQLASYIGPNKLVDAAVYRGTPQGQLERPQLLFENGKPTYMYLATGVNTNSGYGSCSHVFKVNITKSP